jgi:hypothetical protein
MSLRQLQQLRFSVLRLPDSWCAISASIAFTHRLTSRCHPLPPAGSAAADRAGAGHTLCLSSARGATAGPRRGERDAHAPSAWSVAVSIAQNSSSVNWAARSSNASCAGSRRRSARCAGRTSVRGRRRPSAGQPATCRRERAVAHLARRAGAGLQAALDAVERSTVTVVRQPLPLARA